MKKVIVVILVVLILAASLAAVKLFLIGEPADERALVILVEESDRQLTIYIQSMDSALAISNIQYRYEGSSMQLTVWKVLASPIHRDGNTCLYYEITDETEIWLGNRLIWSK